MSGFYNYWPKVNHPNEIFPQMESGEYQPPFFFGGSQVPTALGIKGNGLLTHHHVSTQQPTCGQGIISQKTHHEKHHRIIMPRYMKGIR
jgi:hypothetical protein